MAPRPSARLSALLLVPFLAGCMGAGGAGGDVYNNGNHVSRLFYTSGGNGESGQIFRDGRDGCDLRTQPGQIYFCGLVLDVEAAGFEVSAVESRSAPKWQHMRVGIPDPGYSIKTADSQREVVDRVDISKETRGRAQWVYELGLGAVGEGRFSAGDGFTACGDGGPTDLWVRDTRSIGAAFALRIEPDAC